ncbi:MAG TPA: NAD(P)-dependent oxidoreductase [Candidatus Acidoferrales bacterium]|nr:NAD(P)-dependent oxidoreductase [Candidatus Acidoferrales bacterium]
MTVRVGWIGLGLIGKPMARRLVQAGYPVTLWNRTRAKAEELASEGARVAATPQEAAAAADVLFLCVSVPAAVEAVLWGQGGAMDGLRQGSVLIDSSTVSPGLARREAAAAAARGVAFLEAPVTGGTWGAEKGELVFLIGGEAATLERVQPLLHHLGKRFFHLGPHGSGQTVKLAMNLLYALEVQGLAEALALVTGAGLGSEKLLEVLASSMGRAPVLDMKAPMMTSGNFAPSFPLRLMHKDLGLALELSNELGIPLPATAAARETYSAVKGAAREDVDYAAVMKFWRHA